MSRLEARSNAPAEPLQKKGKSDDSTSGNDPKAALRGKGYDTQVQMLAPEAPKSQKAEMQRLSEEMIRLAQRNAWTGVERAYQSILGLGIPPDGQIHKLAAEAARVSGDCA